MIKLLPKQYIGNKSKIDVQLDYRWFDKATIRKTRKKEHFFNEAYELIKKEECCYISNRLNGLDESEKNSKTLQYIIADWGEEERKLHTALWDLNRQLVDAFSYVGYEIFEQFLDDLEIDEYGNTIEISSSYSEYIHSCSPCDYQSTNVDSYITFIVERDELKIRDFDVGDEFYWLVLKKKFDQEEE